MTQKELIRQEIERQRNFIEGLFIEGDNSFYDGQDDAYNHLLAFIDSLPDENNPEPYNPVYDEEYLNEKIAKATKSWKGVDVNKMLADCRGYEEKPSDELEEAAWDCVLDNIDVNNPVLLPKYKELLLYLFIAGAEWQKEQDTREMVMSDGSYFQKCYKIGKKDMRVEMIKDAVEGEVYKFGDTAYVKESNNADLTKYLSKFDNGDKVKIIVIKQKE